MKTPKLHAIVLHTMAGVLLAAAPLWAHHGSAGFDQKKPVHLAGTVSQVEWNNPHAVIHLDVAEADGKVTRWMVFTRSPNAMIRAGFPKSALSAGMEISVDGYQAKDGSNHVNPTSIVFKDGKKIVSPDCFDAGPGCFYSFKPNGKLKQ